MKTLMVFVMLSCIIQPAFPQGKDGKSHNLDEPLKVRKITGSIVFDGIPDEESWKMIDSLPLTMFMPVPGAEPTERTVAKIAYDDTYLYVSGIFYYADIKDIRVIGKQRDYSDRASDYFGLILDTFNDRENGLQFVTNPNGLRSDATIKNDCLDEDNDSNGSWNTFWDVRSHINDNGWSAEIRIPFSSLRFQTDRGKTLMGLILIVWRPGKPELSTFPEVSKEYSNAYAKPSLSRVIEFENLKPRKPVYITPYLLAGAGQLNVLNPESTGYRMDDTLRFEAGVDLKYCLTNNLTIDLTINTDFAQVEADDQKINLTRYSLYFPEKRVFFLEKSDVFDFSFLEGNNLFYSRRIGLYEGNAVRILGGARLTGRIGKWDIGFLDMQTARFDENPSENFGVLRLKRSVLNKNSYVGGMVTSRLGMNGTYNVAYGLDGQFRVKGNDYVILRMAQSFEDGISEKLMDIKPVRALLQWQRRNIIGLGYDFQYLYSGDNYNPGIGFENNRSYHGPKAKILYGWLAPETSFLRDYSVSLYGYNYWNTASGDHETTAATLTWSFTAKKLYGGRLDLYYFMEDLQDTLILGNNQASVPPGRYSFANFSAGYSTSWTNDLSGSFSATTGRFYDGWRASLYAAPKLKIGSDFDIGFTYYLDYVNFSDREMRFTNHIFGIKGLMTLTTRTSVSAFIQYNTAIHRVISNIRFRYNPKEGNDFYIVYDDTQNTDLYRESPALPHCAGRTLLLKYTYTFRL
jgi:hypothetical protein